MKSKDNSLKIRSLIAAGVGALSGYVCVPIAKMSAEANIHVRPELIDVSWTDAMFAGHFPDWWWYHYPNEASILCIASGALLGLWIYDMYRGAKYQKGFTYRFFSRMSAIAKKK